MALRIPVYISSVNNLSDARYCAGMGVKWLGFSSQDLGANLSENELSGILQWVEGIETILELRSDQFSIESLNLDFDAFLSNNLELIPASDKSRILEFDISQFDLIEHSLKGIKKEDYVLLKSELEVKKIGDKIKPQLIEFARKNKVILGFGINTDNLEWIEKELKPEGIMLKGGNEIRPGFKDFDDLAQILEYLETD